MNRSFRILSVLTALALLAVMLGAVRTASAQAPTATVNTGALNIRSGPGISYSVVISVYRGTALTLLARNADGSWVKVMLAGGAQGWVNARYIATAYPILSLAIEGAPGAATATVNTYALNLRTGPGATYARIAALPAGTVVTLIARTVDASWVKVALASGAVGWVSAGYLVPTVPISSLPVEGGTVPPAPTPPATRTHVVQPGENLFRISLRYGVNMYDVARANGIINLALIYAGQVLLIP